MPPRPKVRSAVLRFRKLSRSRIPSDLEEAYFQAVRAAFRERRKTAANSMARALGLDKSRVESALLAAGVPKDARGQDISPEAYLSLCNTMELKTMDAKDASG